jgi:hypothetical protein
MIPIKAIAPVEWKARSLKQASTIKVHGTKVFTDNADTPIALYRNGFWETAHGPSITLRFDACVLACFLDGSPECAEEFEVPDVLEFVDGVMYGGEKRDRLLAHLEPENHAWKRTGKLYPHILLSPCNVA